MIANFHLGRLGHTEGHFAYADFMLRHDPSCSQPETTFGDAPEQNVTGQVSAKGSAQ